MNPNYEPGYDPEHCKDTEPVRYMQYDDGELCLCEFCEKPIPEDDPAEMDMWHQECYEDNREPPEPDYDAPSMQERAEMDYEQKYHGRGL